MSDPGRITFAMYESYLTETGKGWLCDVEGELAGFAIASSKDSSIWALFVRQEYEGRGIGKKLLSFTTDWLFAAGAYRISLTTEANTRADEFYRRLGWGRSEIENSREVRYTLERPEEARK